MKSFILKSVVSLLAVAGGSSVNADPIAAPSLNNTSSFCLNKENGLYCSGFDTRYGFRCTDGVLSFKSLPHGVCRPVGRVPDCYKGERVFDVKGFCAGKEPETYCVPGSAGVIDCSSGKLLTCPYGSACSSQTPGEAFCRVVPGDICDDSDSWDSNTIIIDSDSEFPTTSQSSSSTVSTSTVTVSPTSTRSDCHHCHHPVTTTITEIETDLETVVSRISTSSTTTSTITQTQTSNATVVSTETSFSPIVTVSTDVIFSQLSTVTTSITNTETIVSTDTSISVVTIPVSCMSPYNATHPDTATLTQSMCFRYTSLTGCASSTTNNAGDVICASVTVA